MFSGLRNLWRLAGIARILARHDALSVLELLEIAPWLVRPIRLFARREARARRMGESLAAAAAALGPSFIKLGQALSTRADLIGADMAADLAQLRDRLAPFPAAAARRIVADELGAPVENLFRVFEDQPVAAASIAQVHFAVTDDGRPVAVKVLRPGVERAFQRDLDLFLWLAKLVERARPRQRRLRLTESVNSFADTVAVEMDLSLEGAAATELADNFAGDPDLHVPAVDWRRTARRVLTTERVPGSPLGDAAALAAAGHDPAEFVAKAARTTFNQVFRDGFFHGDPHQGNIFVGADGALWLVDFGITGRLDMPTRRFLANMLAGFLDRDYARVARVHFEAGFVPPDKPMGAFISAVRAIGEPIHGLPAHEISVGRVLGQLFHTTEQFGMPVQPRLLLLQKVMVVAEGVARALHPQANMWEIARPLIEDWAIANAGPDARARAALDEAAAMVRRLPRLAERAEQVLTRLDAPPPRLSRRAIATGFFAGFAAGALLFMVLVLWL